MSAANYSLYAVPAYYLIAMAPQFYATSVVKRATRFFDNAGPRSLANQERLKAKCSAADFALYERARAAHVNSLESFPLVSLTLLAGSWAGLAPASLNASALALVALRVVYLFLYINISSVKLSYTRTAVWTVSRLVCLTVLFRVAGVAAAGGP